MTKESVFDNIAEMITLFNIIVLICFSVNFALASTLMPVFKNSRKHTALFYFTANNMFLSAFPVLRSMNPQGSLLKYLAFGSVPFWVMLSPLFLEYTLLHIERRNKLDRFVQVTTFVISYTVLIIHIFSDKIISGYDNSPYGIITVLGPWFTASALLSIVPAAFYAIYLIFKKALTTRDKRIKLAFYEVSAGVFLGLSAGLITDVIVPIFYPDAGLPRIGFAFTAVGSLVFFRAFHSYYLLDVFMSSPISKLFNLTSDGVIFIRKNGAILAMNPSAKRLLELQTDATYDSISDLSDDLYNIFNLINRELQDTEENEEYDTNSDNTDNDEPSLFKPIEAIIITGQNRKLCARISPCMESKNSECLLIIIHDITETTSRIHELEEYSAELNREMSIRQVELEDHRQGIESLSRHLKIRNEVWTLAGQHTDDLKLLTAKIMETIGKGFEVSRASYVENKEGRFRCVTEWCAQNIKSSLDYSLPEETVNKMVQEGALWINPENLKQFKKLYGDEKSREEIIELFNDLNVACMYLYPIREEGILTSIFTLDICKNTPSNNICNTIDFSDLDSRILEDAEKIIRISAARIASEKAMMFSGRLAEVGTMAAGIAHELKNMIALIRGFSDIMARHTDISDSARQMNERIRMAAIRAESITRNVLSYSSSPKVSKTSVRLDETIRETVELVSEFLESNSIYLITDLSSCPEIPLDKHQISQVFLNLILNSANAMKSVPSKQLYLTCKSTQSHVIASIRDSGPGIPEEYLPKIFDPFFTFRSMGKSTFSGSGLGLSVSKAIIMNHDGKISAYNCKSGGAVFEIMLPLYPQSMVPSFDSTAKISSEITSEIDDPEVSRLNESSLEKNPEYAGPSSSFNKDNIPDKVGRKIMIIDDERDIVEMIAFSLSDSNHHIITPQSAQDALTIIENGEMPDIVLLDMSMPGIDGISFMDMVADIIQDQKPPNYVLVTGIQKPEVLRHLDGRKVLSIVSKPFDINTLAELLSGDIE